MLKIDEDALTCDLAETYKIYDYKEWPPNKVAIFAIGLRDDSRIKMKLSDSRATPEVLLLSMIVDHLGVLRWFKTEDGHKGINPPESMLERFYPRIEKESSVATFKSGKEFTNEWNKLANKEGGN